MQDDGSDDRRHNTEVLKKQPCSRWHQARDSLLDQHDHCEGSTLQFLGNDGLRISHEPPIESRKHQSSQRKDHEHHRLTLREHDRNQEDD